MKSVTKRIMRKTVHPRRVDKFHYELDPVFRFGLDSAAFKFGLDCALSIDTKIVKQVSKQLEGNYLIPLLVDDDLRTLKLPFWMYVRSPKLTLDYLKELRIKRRALRKSQDAGRRFQQALTRMKNRHANTTR